MEPPPVLVCFRISEPKSFAYTPRMKGHPLRMFSKSSTFIISNNGYCDTTSQCIGHNGLTAGSDSFSLTFGLNENALG